VRGFQSDAGVFNYPIQKLSEEDAAELKIITTQRRMEINVASLQRRCGAVWCSVVQCGAVRCSVMRCFAVCCSVLLRSSAGVVQCGAVWCSVVQCGAV